MSSEATAIPIQEAVVRAARDRSDLEGRKARAWQLAIGSLDDGYLSRETIDAWIEQDIELTNRASASIRAAEWIVEGFRPGSTQLEVPQQAWWARPVRLDLRRERVEWNGVKICGLMVRSSALAGAPEAEEKPVAQRPTDRHVAREMTAVAEAYLAAHGRKMERGDAILECRMAFPSDRTPTKRQLGNAYKSLPINLKRQRGEQTGR